MKTKNLRELSEDYFKYKHACKIKFRSGEYYIKRYISFHECNYPEAMYPIRESVCAFEESMPDHKQKQHITYLKGFCRYLKELGYEVYVSKTKIYSDPPELPYIISDEEGNAFFKALDQLPPSDPSHWNGKQFVLPSFFRMMWCCGTRTQETRFLLCRDMNLEEAYFDIVNSKGDKDRRIFLSKELCEYYREYDEKMKLLVPGRKYFFSGKFIDHPITAGTASRNFKDIWYTAFPDFDRSIRIRPYDFRHHFVYENINRWLREDKNVNVMIYYLMQVTGHKTPDELLYYFHLVPEIYGVIKERTIKLNHVYPKQYHTEEEEDL